MPTHRDLPHDQDGWHGVPDPSLPPRRVTVNDGSPRRSAGADHAPRGRGWVKLVAWGAVLTVGTAGFVWSQRYGHVSDLAGKPACLPSVCDNPPRHCPDRPTFHLPNGAIVCQFPPGNMRLGPYRPCKSGTTPIDNPSDERHESRRHDIHEFKNRPVAPSQCFGPK